jgi:hypothetical protein
MPQYRISYWEEQGGFIYFNADNKEQAMELYNQLQEGAIENDDLPDMVNKWKNGQIEYEKPEEVI